MKKNNHNSTGSQQNLKIIENCPHCGSKLSPWEQVILSVDRALMCKHCWYRIILDAFDDQKNKGEKSEEKEK